MSCDQTRYSFHLEFEDGSDPFLLYNVLKDRFLQERAKWEKKYSLVLDRFVKGTNGDYMYFYIASEQGVNQNGS